MVARLEIDSSRIQPVVTKGQNNTYSIKLDERDYREAIDILFECFKNKDAPIEIKTTKNKLLKIVVVSFNRKTIKQNNEDRGVSIYCVYQFNVMEAL